MIESKRTITIAAALFAGLVMLLTAAGPASARAAAAGKIVIAADHGSASGHGEAAGHETATGSEAEDAGGAADEHAKEGKQGGAHHVKVPPIPIWGFLPFLGILLSIAILPLVNAHWWEHNFPKVSLAWGLPTVVGIMFLGFDVGKYLIIHTTVEYLGFLALLTALYTVAGGILVKGSFKGSPVTNTVILAIGSVIASFVGTTGAAMILIRPVIRANSFRKSQVLMIVFFIFLVCNIGGSLTPLGDPPLFLGFLRGVPFAWTLQLLPMWAISVAVLLVLFFVLDTLMFKKQGGFTTTAATEHVPVGLEGTFNFLFIGCIVGVVLLYAKLPDSLGFIKPFVQIVLMIGIAALSMKFTKREVRERNGFTWNAIREVAILFAAIFATMIPALQILEQRGAELGVTQPWQFFWATGITSSFLDNAPTYLTYMSLAKTIPAVGSVVPLTDGSSVANLLLLPIACGAVFMGANTYIGNAPNFMVKAIAEENHIKMPSFFGYMVYSSLILVPLFIAITYIFFKG